MSHLVVVGDALVDIVDGEQLPGGAALNVAVGVARLGSRVQLVAMVADDEPGRVLRAHCATYGVELISTPAPLGSATATATRVGGSMHYEFNEAARRRFIDLDPVQGLLDDADLVVASCLAFEHPEQVAPLLAIHEPSKRLVLDPNPRPGYLPDAAATARFAAAVDRVGSRARLVKLGDEDSALLWGEDVHASARRLLAAGAATVLVTEGPGGATAYTPTARIHAPVTPMAAPIVDTIGAGDATIATVAAALADAEVGDDLWPDVLDDAMRVAAATCRVAGGLLQYAA